MKKQLILFLLSFLITHLLLGQTDPNNVPKPPIEKLKIFEPYFGNYKHTMNYAGMDWSGTMEIKPIIKGWYVDWTILTKSADNKIDREYHMLVTYDTAMRSGLCYMSLESSLQEKRVDTLYAYNDRNHGGQRILFFRVP